jgi:hypothetical protein
MINDYQNHLAKTSELPATHPLKIVLYGLAYLSINQTLIN